MTQTNFLVGVFDGPRIDSKQPKETESIVLAVTTYFLL